MIRINLIPAKKKKKAKPVPPFIIGLVGLLALAIVASVLGINYFNGKIKDLENQKKSNEAKIADLKEKIKEVEGFEQRNKVFMDRKKIIEELTKNQSLPAKVLDEMAARLTNGVWLTAMTITRNKISVTGVGFSPNDVVDYVDSLKASPLFTSVVLGGTTSGTISKTNVYNFSITMDIKA